MSTSKTSAPAILAASPKGASLGRAQNSRPIILESAPKSAASAGSDSLDGQAPGDTHRRNAVEGGSSPQAIPQSGAMSPTPAGATATAAASGPTIPKALSPLPFKTNQAAQDHPVAHLERGGLVEDLPGDQRMHEDQSVPVAGDTAQPTAIGDTEPRHCPLSAATLPRAANHEAAPEDAALLADQAGSPAPAIAASVSKDSSPDLADPLLALAADVLDDLESVRIANENRLRQLTRDEEDSDGEERGFGLTLDHPDVARLNALVSALADAEKAATKNLEKRLREHALYPWLRRQKGVGDKQAARLLASIGDPYMRPELVREDGTVEPARPRRVSELWAYCGYHVLPVSIQRGIDTHTRVDAGRTINFPAGQAVPGLQSAFAGGGKTGHPDHENTEFHGFRVGVAPKRARGQRANWSSTAKMRAYLIAESTMKQLKRTCPADEVSGYATHADECDCSHYRKVYDATREKYADATHAVECVRCGPKGKPAPVGSDLSRKHKQARALRKVAKELLKDLWREARRIHLGEEETT